MKKFIRINWPLIISTVLLFTTIAGILIYYFQSNNSPFVYPLDDTYIHMALAKNLSQHGIFGVSKYEFTFSSSSILWTLLLAFIYRLFGVHDIIPFSLNIVFSFLALVLIHNILKKYITNRVFIFLLMIAILYLSSVPLLIFQGMEHILQMTIAIAFVYLVSSLLSKEEFSTGDTHSRLMLIIVPFVTLVRYEGLFLIFVVCILLALRKHFGYGLVLGVLAITPLLIFSIISWGHGWYPFPNSVILKGTRPSDLHSIQGVYSYFMMGIWRIFTHLHIHNCILAGLSLYIINTIRNKYGDISQIMLILFLVVCMLHTQFGRVGAMYWFRYEAYLIAVAIIAIGLALRNDVSKINVSRFTKRSICFSVAVALYGFILIWPLGANGKSTLTKIPIAMKNIHDQHVQMGLFLSKYYQDQGVAANDIGAINYLADVKNLDLYGIGSIEVARLRLNKNFNTQTIYNLAKTKNIKIAIVYDFWYEDYGGLPSAWIKVGEWTISNNVACGSSTVAFYAVERSEARTLFHHLESFAPALPESVRQTLLYHPQVH